MRPSLAALACATLLMPGCGARPLRQQAAEEALRKGYPARITVTVPEGGVATPDSPDFDRFDLFQMVVERRAAQVFEVVRTPEGKNTRFTFRLRPNAPKDIQLGPEGFVLPAAEATFQKATKMQAQGHEARVTYLVRLDNPTPYFPIFAALHPGVKAGDQKERKATFVLRGSQWALRDTDEKFKPAHP